MIVDVGKVKILGLLDDNLSDGKFGDDSTVVSATDSDLYSELTSTVSTLSATQTSKQLNITYNLNSVTGNGETLREYGNFITDGTSEILLNRVTFTELPKTTAIEVQVSTIVNIV